MGGRWVRIRRWLSDLFGICGGAGEEERGGIGLRSGIWPDVCGACVDTAISLPQLCKSYAAKQMGAHLRGRAIRWVQKTSLDVLYVSLTAGMSVALRGCLGLKTRCVSDNINIGPASYRYRGLRRAALCLARGSYDVEMTMSSHAQRGRRRSEMMSL